MIRGFKLAVLVLAHLAFFTLGLSMLSYPMMAEEAGAELDLSYAESGLVMSILWLSYAGMQIPAGFLSDRWGGGRVMLASAITLGVSGLAFMTSNSFEMALLARALMGVGGGGLLPASVRVLSSWFSEKELGLAMGVFAAGWGASQVTAFTVVPAFVMLGSWRTAALFVGVFTLGSAVAFSYLLRGGRGPGAEATRRVKVGMRRVLTPTVGYLTAVNFAGLAAIAGIATWTPLFLMSRFQIPAQEAGLIVAIVGVANIAAAFAGGVVTGKLGRASVILIAMAMCTLLPVGLVFSPTAAWTLYAVVGIGWATMFYAPAMLAWVPSATPLGREGAGTTFGVLNTASNAGPFLSPFIMGYILDVTFSYIFAFATLSSLASVGLVGSVLLMFRRQTADRPRREERSKNF